MTLITISPLTDDIFWDGPVEDFNLVKAQQNLINLSDNLFSDGTFAVEPDCVEWTQRDSSNGQERGPHGDFNFRCDCVWSIMSGDRKKADELIPQLSLYEAVSLTEVVLRFYLYEVLSRKDLDWGKHLDILTLTTPFKRAMVEVLGFESRHRGWFLLYLVSQSKCHRVNTRTRYTWYKSKKRLM